MTKTAWPRSDTIRVANITNICAEIRKQEFDSLSFTYVFSIHEGRWKEGKLDGDVRKTTKINPFFLVKATYQRPTHLWCMMIVEKKDGKMSFLIITVMFL